MKLKMDDSIVVPLGTCKRYLVLCDEDDFRKEDTDEDEDFLTVDISYPPLNYNGEFYWNEMSYHRLTETSTTWHYDFYSQGNW